MPDIKQACDTIESVWQRRLEQAVAAERERCIKIAHDHSGYHGGEDGYHYDYNCGYQRAAIDIEAAIRKGE